VYFSNHWGSSCSSVSHEQMPIRTKERYLWLLYRNQHAVFISNIEIVTVCEIYKSSVNSDIKTEREVAGHFQVMRD
jgi:hypothetical protein